MFSVNDTWPPDDFSIEANYKDLKEHQDEFDNRQGFAYTVVNEDETECVGCVYIRPWTRGTYDAFVFYWVTDKVKAEGFEEELGFYIDKWLKSFWSLSKTLYPGRNIALKDWETLTKSFKTEEKSLL